MASKPELTLKIPRLLNVFRAHAFPITCITYVADRELIITGDQGKAVRIWLLSGRYIGTCGEPWQSLISPQQKMVQLRHLPSELRHCLSARTFKVIQVGAKHLLWDKAIRLVKQHLRGRQYKEKVTGKEKKEEKTKSSESLDQEWRNPRRSSILGSTYKPNLHYKPRPAIFTQNNIKKFPAFHTLPIYDIQDIQKISKPRLTYRQDVHQTMIPLLDESQKLFQEV
ncbi:WD repeat-containing protein on Y chromosome-like [Pomacea canaliculata]|uniref:WD repeat-containing protein on Y chromosome-like n=1 Tax=Pomacea canaliculata TaxID=400727 RepID=UPI000D73AB8B|nr:WD repeat-containing protein on Y chromosome-like [Pomacea canaliculata]